MSEDPAGPKNMEAQAGGPFAPEAGLRLQSVDLDLGAKTSLSQRRVGRIDLEPYNQTKETDAARKYIAFWLIGILSGVVAIALLTCLVLIYFDTNDKDRFDHLLAVINLIFGPIIALVGSATGFYFGSQSQSSKQDGGRGAG